MAMMSPFPRKAFDSVSSQQPATMLHTPKADAFSCYNGPRSFWCVDDEATKDLHEAISGKTKAQILPDYLPAFHASSASSASTSCFPTPDLDRSVSPVQSSSPSQVSEAACTPPLETAVPRGRSSPGWLQARKVFVGGVPQRIEQQDLLTMFSIFGKIKKAWLQLPHQDQYMNRECGVRNHRGFGFVIFSDTSAVDRMLGDDYSKFVSFDGLRLEVKRAVGKDHVSGEADSTRKGGEKLTAYSPACQKAYPTTPPISAQMSTNFDGYDLPPVPPFPMWSSSDAPGHEKSETMQTILLPATLSLLPTTQLSSLQNIFAPCVTDTSLSNIPDVLLEGFIGQKPRNKKELERALLQALPDHYDD